MHGKFLNILMSCSSKDCDCNVVVVDEKTSAHLQCVDLICFECKHRRQLSLEDYNLMCNVNSRRIMQKLTNSTGLSEEFFRRTFMELKLLRESEQ